MNLKYLSAPFPRQAVHWRAQTVARSGDKALALAYLDARDVMDRLDMVCGPENWQDEYTETARGRVLCKIGIRVGDDWVWKSDGAGETAVEGEKGGISDALKRAAVHWGIGRYLYRFDAVWCPSECKDTGKKDNWGNTIWRWSKWAANPWDFVKDAPTAPDEIARAMFQDLKGGKPPEQINEADKKLVSTLVPSVYTQHIEPFFLKEAA